MSLTTPSPITAAFVFVLTCTLSVAAGFALGIRHRKGIEAETGAIIGGVIAATLGLLAFTLGFTFNIAAARFDLRRSLVLEEANAVRTLYLRSQLLPQQLGRSFPSTIKEYLAARVIAAKQPASLPNVEPKTEKLLDELWRPAAEAAIRTPDSEMAALFLETLGTVIELHSTRVNIGIYRRIPPPVWLVLALVACLSMVGIGFQFGIAGRLNIIATVILVCAFTAVIALIADLDHPHKGTLRVSQTPLENVLKDIQRWEEAKGSAN